MTATRRDFLKFGALALTGIGVSGMLPGVLQPLALAAKPERSPGRKPPVLIVIFQRGAADGLNVVVPHGDSAYYDARSTIAIARPGQADGALDLDGHFGLHPALSPLLPFWRDGRMAAVHAAGSPDNSRSHFVAQDYMESGTPGVKLTREGWLNRLLQTEKGQGAPSPFAGVAMTADTPHIMEGDAPVVAMTSLQRFAVQAGAATGSISNGFEELWQKAGAGALGEAGHESLGAVQFLQRSGAANLLPENGARYPSTDFGEALRQLAQLVKADVGLRLGFANIGGWDTHAGQGSVNGQLAKALRELGAGIAAFLTDLGPKRDDVMLVTMSEFGRTVHENGTRGTDHGHGNVMFLFGNHLNGGRVHGRWPGLEASQLYEERDLAVTTDFRSVLSEVVQRHLGAKHLAEVFPSFDAQPVGVVKG